VRKVTLPHSATLLSLHLLVHHTQTLTHSHSPQQRSAVPIADVSWLHSGKPACKLCILEGTGTKTSEIRGNFPQMLKCLYILNISSWICYWNVCGCSLQRTLIRTWYTFNKMELHQVWHKVLRVCWWYASKMLGCESMNSLWPVRSYGLTNNKIFCRCISCSRCAFPCFQDEVKEVQDSVSKTTVLVNINVLTGYWQKLEYSVDVCYVNGSTAWEFL
jgi:hypothetical protein